MQPFWKAGILCCEKKCGVLGMLFSELKSKSVINVRDCKCLGKICDLEFDERNGCILKIIIPKGGGLCNLFKTEGDFVIPFCDIKQIGPDIILVDICL